MAVQEISVYITPDPSDPKGEPKITVDQDLAGVHSGSSVMWDFHSVVPDVTWAQIEFNQGINYFRARPHSPANVRYTELHGGHGEILGTAPEIRPPGAAPISANHKYTVRVFRAPQGSFPPTEQPTQLDPSIIVCDP
jgi:hypothetical protein